MKPFGLLALCAVALSGTLADEPFPDIGAHHRWVPGAGAARANRRGAQVRTGYVQLETGLNRLENGRWVETQELLEVIDNHVVARKTAQQVIWAANANSVGAVDVLWPGGQRLRSHCLGLGYFDPESGKSVLIAELKDSTAEINQPNVVLYRDAFDDVDADLVYVNRRGSFEQLVVLHARPPAPDAFGLPAACRLEVITEFVDPPVPRKSPKVVAGESDLRKRAAMADPDLVDEDLDFGAFSMPRGQAFLPAGAAWQADAASAIPVGKRWQVTPEGRTVLFEAVEYKSLEPLLTTLEASPRAVAQARTPAKERTLPVRKVASIPARPIQVAAKASPSSQRSVTIDYTTVSSGLTDFTFQSGTTYFVTSTITLSGSNTTFEANSVIKFAKNNNAGLEVASTNVTWLGAPYRPVTLTGSDDATVGEVVTTGSFTNYYAATALNVKAPCRSVDLPYLRVRNAQTAVVLRQGSTNVLRHAQIMNCGTAVQLTNAIASIKNALIGNTTTVFDLGNSTSKVEHLTVDTASLLNTGGTLCLTNSLLVAVSSTNAWSGTANTVLSSGSGVFASVEAGAHYLAMGSPYRNVGTTGISSDLQTDLRQLTTVAPVSLSNAITIATTLGPQAGRDTDQPDQGYHYPPLDYVACSFTNTSAGIMVTNATLTLRNGVAMGFFAPTWIWPRGGASIVSSGAPGRLNHLSALTLVQELALPAYANSAGQAAVYPSGDTPSTGRFQFTAFDGRTPSDYSVFCGPGSQLSSLECRHCDLGVGLLYVEGESTNLSVTLINNLFDRHPLSILGTASVTLYNNLCRYGDYFLLNDGGNPWTAKDNAFEGGFPGSTGLVGNGFNAYINTGSQLTGGTNDVILTNFVYATGTLGRFYQSSTNLLDKGSRTAAAAGLYHFTVLTSQVKDGTTVEIGLHYVATDSSGNPLDGDSDGWPDWWEDTSGGGTVDSGELDWQSASDPGLKVRITRPADGSIIP